VQRQRKVSMLDVWLDILLLKHHDKKGSISMIAQWRWTWSRNLLLRYFYI